MRWEKRKTIVSVCGDQRVIDKFLWWPLTLNGQTRWLERARIKQERLWTSNAHGALILWQNKGWVY